MTKQEPWKVIIETPENIIMERVITDPNYKIEESTTIKVGKRRWIKIEVEE